MTSLRNLPLQYANSQRDRDADPRPSHISNRALIEGKGTPDISRGWVTTAPNVGQARKTGPRKGRQRASLVALRAMLAVTSALLAPFGALSSARAQQAPSSGSETSITEFHSTPAGTPKTNTDAAARSPGPNLGQEPIPPVGLGGRQITGSIEFGPRWRDVAGNENLYRSHVNLGTGMKLYHSDVEVTTPENVGVLFDRFRMTMDSWGGDPYNSASVRFQKFRVYDFQYRYQKIDYFNYVPEFANPLFGRDILTGQHTFDIARRLSNARIDFFPDSKRFKFHLNYGRNSSFGPARISFNGGGDEFVVPRFVKNSYDDYGAGVDFSLWKFRFSLDQGYRRFRDDQGWDQPGGFNIGNDPLPIFTGPRAMQLFLSTFARNYHVRGSFPTTRFAVTSQPHRRVSLTARFYYGEASLNYAFSQALIGRVYQMRLQRYITNSSAQDLASSSRPQTVADGSFGVALTQRLTLSNTFRFDHFDVAGSTLLNEILFTAGGPFTAAPPDQRTLNTFSDRRIFLNSFYNQIEARYELIPGLVLRGGFRHTHRRVAINKFANDPFLRIGSSADESRLDTRTGLVGFSYRLRHEIRVALDYENGSYDNVFTQVGPIDHQRARLRAQFRPSNKWIFTVSGLLTDLRRPNRPVIRPFSLEPDPSTFLSNQDRYRDAGFSASYFPTGRIALDVDYTRGHAGASIDVLRPIPPGQQLKYREDTHIGHSAIEFALYKDLKLSLGYSLVSNSGSYPINFHRPFGGVSIPLQRRLQLRVTYQYYGYNERGRSVQDYHANLLTTSFRFVF